MPYLHFDVRHATCEHLTLIHKTYATMGVRSMRLAFFALVAVLVCSVYAQSTEKSAAKIDVGSLSTQEIEEHLQVCRM